MKTKPKRLDNLAVAALTFAVQAGARNQLLPAGSFRAIDGRPENCPSWYIDSTSAAALMARVAARKNDLLVDYEHTTLRVAKNGGENPAAGWIGTAALSWDESTGLFADIQWTDAAKTKIESDAYRYLSPTIVYDPKTGQVVDILHVALTNFAAIDGMDEASIAAASAFAAALTSTQTETTMDQALLEKLLGDLSWMLGLPTGATLQDYIAQLEKITGQLKSASGATAAASFDLAKHLADSQTQIAALSAAAPDPAQFVPMAQFAEMQSKVAALAGQLETGERGSLMTAALSDGRILPAQREYWAAQPVAALSAYLAVAQPVAALSGMQSGAGKIGAGSGDVAALTAEQVKLCAQMRIPEADYLASLKAEAV